MNIKKTYTILFVLMLLSACNPFNKQDVINKNKFIEILTDIHKAGAVAEFKNLKEKSIKSDSTSIYNFVLKKHNVSRNEFNKTVDYYAEHYDDYLEIYDKIEENLKKEEEKLNAKVEYERQKELSEKKENKNLWNLKKYWKLPEDGRTNQIPFNIRTNEHGTYELKAKIRIFKDDKSVNQKMVITANYYDNTKDRKIIKITGNKNKFKEYGIKIKTNEHKKLKSISGKLLEHERGTIKKHSEIKDISLKIIKPDKTKIR